MTKTISEGLEMNGASNSVLNESLIPFDMRELASYVAHEDKRIKAISESLEFNIADDYSNVNIDKVNRFYSIKEGNDTLKIFLKKSLIEDMDNYFKYRF